MTREEALQHADKVLSELQEFQAQEGLAPPRGKRNDDMTAKARKELSDSRVREQLADLIMKDPSMLTTPAIGNRHKQ